MTPHSTKLQRSSNSKLYLLKIIYYTLSNVLRKYIHDEMINSNGSLANCAMQRFAPDYNSGRQCIT